MKIHGSVKRATGMSSKYNKMTVQGSNLQDGKVQMMLQQKMLQNDNMPTTESQNKAMGGAHKQSFSPAP